MLVADDERRYVEVNEAACRLLRSSRETILGARMDDFLPDETRSWIGATWRSFIENGYHSAEYTMLCGDETTVEVELRSQANVVPGRHLAVLRDIMDRKAAEQVRGVRENLRFLSTVLEHVGPGLLVVDGQGCIVLANATAASLLGYDDRKDLIGLDAHDTFHHKRHDQSPYPAEWCPIERVRSSGEWTTGDEWFVRRDGSMFPISYSSSPVPLAGATGAVVMFRDVSERRAEEKRLQEQLDAVTWAVRVRDALSEERMAVYSAPVLDLRARTVDHRELLIRMIDRGGEPILPRKFLPIAEQFGLAPEIDRWMLTQALRTAEAHGPVAVPISTASVGDPYVLRTIEQMLGENGAGSACRLIFQVDESALIKDLDSGSRFARRLSELGCRLAVDDAALGYGSFKYLKRLRVSFLKIDPQFVRNLAADETNQQVVEAIVGLARSFGQRTVAAGVEDQATVEVLERLGVDYGQGPFFGGPEPLSEAST